MNTQRKEEQFSIDGLARVRVTNIRGSVLIQAGCTGEIRVEVAVDPESGDPDRTQVELTQLPDGTVVAETRFSKGLTDLLGGRRDRSCRVDFHLRVPPACEVTLDAVSSTAALQGLEATWTCKQ